MRTDFTPDCLPTLIGSLPMTDHREAAELVLAHAPDIPIWVQLPSRKQEGMIAQFLPGMPGFRSDTDRLFIDSEGEAFDTALLAFYEDYVAVVEGGSDLLKSRFAMGSKEAEGFFVFLERVFRQSPPPVAVKGQITGPVTLTTGVGDRAKRAIVYDDRLRDAAVKLLAMKARWQVRQLSGLGRPVILFLDEPALAGYGSSEFTSISRADIAAMIGEVADGIHTEGARAGIHVCANTDWEMVLESPVDIVNFDAYAHFDRFMLYTDALVRFLESGRIIAWGIVPTANPEDIDRESTDTLTALWNRHVDRVASLGIDRRRIAAQSLITPACGTGSLDVAHATRVLELTRAVSDRLRQSL